MCGTFLVRQRGPCLPDIAQRYYCSVSTCDLSNIGITASGVSYLGVCPAIAASLKSKGILVVPTLLGAGLTDINGLGGTVAEV